MNADIAAAGIGIAVIFEPNRKFIDAVLRGQDAARSRRGGPLQQSARIHPPAQVEQAAAQLETLSTELSATSGEVAIVLAGVDSALLAAQATRLSLERTDDPIHAGAYEAVRGDLRTRLQGAIQHGESMRTWLALEHQRLAKAERRAERKAAEAEAARRAVAREAAEREAAERRREEKRQRTTSPRTSSEPASSDPYPGYTGPAMLRTRREDLEALLLRRLGLGNPSGERDQRGAVMFP